MFVVWFFGLWPLARALVALARAVAMTWSFLASDKILHFENGVFAMVSMALTVLGDLSRMRRLMQMVLFIEMFGTCFKQNPALPHVVKHCVDIKKQPPK